MRSILCYLVIGLFPTMLYAQTGYVQEGKASFYADKFEGRTTASGERYSHARSTCAHLTLPFGTLVRVTNLANNQDVVVRVNDRGPFVPNRVIDLSRSAADKLGFLEQGLADVRIEVIDEEGKIIATQSEQSQRPTEISRPTPPAKTTNAEQPATQQKPDQQKAQPEAIAQRPGTKPAATSATQTETSDIELYELKVVRQKPSGFSVQIGSYKELVNLLRIADDLKNSLKKEVRVQVLTINGEKIYRLMVGEFSSRRDAEAFRIKAIQFYPDCFIVEIK